MRHECFLVITLPAVENKRSGVAEVAGKTSARELLKLQEYQVHASPTHPTKGKNTQHRCAFYSSEEHGMRTLAPRT